MNELDLADRVQLIGRVTQPELLHYFAHCRAVCFPPLAEDYGFVTVEAFSSRKAVVTCTDSGGPAELVGDGDRGFRRAPDAGGPRRRDQAADGGQRPRRNAGAQRLSPGPDDHLARHRGRAARREDGEHTRGRHELRLAARSPHREEVTKAITDYRLIEDGDRVMVGLSGGKDSWALLRILDVLRQRAPIRFSLIGVTVDSGYDGYRHDLIASTCEARGWDAGSSTPGSAK